MNSFLSRMVENIFYYSNTGHLSKSDPEPYLDLVLDVSEPDLDPAYDTLIRDKKKG
jgi:hypothetical protein